METLGFGLAGFLVPFVLAALFAAAVFLRFLTKKGWFIVAALVIAAIVIT